MTRRWLPAGAALSVALSACSSSPPFSPTAVPSSVPPATSSSRASAGATLPHVMLLVLENHEYADVIGSGDAPALNALARRYGLATQSYARTHPSLPNYLELVTGRTFGISSDCTSCHVEAQTIADQVAARGGDWAAYMEDMPSPCFDGDSAGAYARKHNPLIYVDHIRANRGACARIQPLTAFSHSVQAGTLPEFTEVTPNLCHDGHDCSLRASDAWVGDFTTTVIASSWYQRGGVLIVTYDEGSSDAGCCRVAGGGHIATLVISRSTPAGARLDTPVDHAGVLRTVEELFGVPFLGDAACACSGDLLPLVD